MIGEGRVEGDSGRYLVVGGSGAGKDERETVGEFWAVSNKEAGVRRIRTLRLETR